MSDEYGSNYLTIADEEGNEFELEVLDTIEFEGASYTVFLPANIDEMDADDPDYGFVILKSLEEKGEEFYSSVDDEDELNRVYEYYMELLDKEDEESGD